VDHPDVRALRGLISELAVVDVDVLRCSSVAVDVETVSLKRQVRDRRVIG
jgi:hypothetical protein